MAIDDISIELGFQNSKNWKLKVKEYFFSKCMVLFQKKVRVANTWRVTYLLTDFNTAKQATIRLQSSLRI
jgi:hypothetical protein